MRKKISTLAQGIGAALLFVTAGASDMGAASVGKVALGLFLAVLLIALGTLGKRYVPDPRRRGKRAAA